MPPQLPEMSVGRSQRWRSEAVDPAKEGIPISSSGVERMNKIGDEAID